MSVVSGVHLESDAFIVVIHLDSNVEVLTILSFHNSEPLFVRVGNSVSHLVASIFEDFLFKLIIELWSDQIGLVLGIINRWLDVSVWRNQVLVFGVQVVSSAVSLESLGWWLLVQYLILIVDNVLDLNLKSLLRSWLSNVVGKGEDLDFVLACNLWWLIDINVWLLLISR